MCFITFLCIIWIRSIIFLKAANQYFVFLLISCTQINYYARVSDHNKEGNYSIKKCQPRFKIPIWYCSWSFCLHLFLMIFLKHVKATFPRKLFSSAISYWFASENMGESKILHERKSLIVWSLIFYKIFFYKTAMKWFFF